MVLAPDPPLSVRARRDDPLAAMTVQEEVDELKVQHDDLRVYVGGISSGTPGSVWYNGTGAPAGSLGVVGDYYLDTANGNVYNKTGAATWALVGNIKGPTGATGPVGPAGPTGATGATGPTGAAGPPGSVWWTGSGAPASGTGIVGDFYLNSANGDYYQKTGTSTWTLQGNIKGPTGATGATGSPGATGPTGPGVPVAGLTNQVLAKNSNTDFDTKWISPTAVPDADASTKGILQLAGDLAGTAASPQIAAGAIVDADISASAAIAKSKLAGLNIVNADVNASAGIDFSKLNLHVGATPPTLPSSGDMWIYNGATGIYWVFIYDSTEPTYKWKFVGGGSLQSGPAGSLSTSSTAFVDLTSGPTLTLPRAGDYIISWGFLSAANNGTAGTYNMYGGLNVGGTLVSQVAVVSVAAFGGGPIVGLQKVTGVAASALVKLQCMIQSGGQPSTFQNGWLRADPVRVI